MSNEFMREERYFVFKISDVVEHLTTTEALHLARLYEIQRVGRQEVGKSELECVVVEKDWPEYESTWKAIEARVTGAQLAPNAVAYLDLGVGGYMDIGTDLTDEELDAIPKGRHMLGIVGTYGIDGYFPAQPAPSINEGVRKVTLGFRWESEAQHHIPTIEIEFEPVSPESPNDAKSWQDRDRLAAMLTPEAKP